MAAREDGGGLAHKGSAKQDKGFLSTFNLMQHDVDTQEEEYVNPAVVGALEQQADGDMKRSTSRRDTQIKGNKVVLTERITRLTHAQIQLGLAGNEKVDTWGFDAKFAKRQQDQRRQFTVPPNGRARRSLFCQMLREGCEVCSGADHGTELNYVGDHLSTHGKSNAGRPTGGGLQ